MYETNSKPAEINHEELVKTNNHFRNASAKIF